MKVTCKKCNARHVLVSPHDEDYDRLEATTETCTKCTENMPSMISLADVRRIAVALIYVARDPRWPGGDAEIDKIIRAYT